MNQIKFVYFDIGGVFLDWRSFVYYIFRNSGLDWPDFYQTFAHYDGLACRNKIDINELGKIYNKEFNLGMPAGYNFLDFWTKGFFPLIESHQLAHEIVKKYPVGFLTNIYKGCFAKQVEFGKTPEIPYSVLVESSSFGFKKPEKDIFDIAIEKSGFKVEEILFIDDEKRNTEAAQKLGFQTFLFNQYSLDDSISGVKEILKV
jgi:FMN phosphatase YigB (HAD superfamily)